MTLACSVWSGATWTFCSVPFVVRLTTWCPPQRTVCPELVDLWNRFVKHRNLASIGRLIQRLILSANSRDHRIRRIVQKEKNADNVVILGSLRSFDLFVLFCKPYHVSWTCYSVITAVATVFCFCRLISFGCLSFFLSELIQTIS